MQLDAFTLMVGLCAIVLLLGGQFLYFWSRDREAIWLAWWAMPFLLGAAGLMLYIPRGRISDFISIGVANAFLISAFGFAWQATRVFERRKPMMWPLLAALALWAVLCFVPAFMASMAWRVVFLSIVNAGFCCGVALELWRGRSELLPSRLPAIGIFLAFAAFIVLRIPWIIGASFPMGTQSSNGALVAISGLAAIVSISFFTMLMVSMTKERLELEQRNFALADPLTGLLNRRAFIREGELMARRAQHGNEPLALLMLDIDHFKSVNDRFGHNVGDRVLMTFASVAQASLRSTDLLYRIGGEEFCFLLPDTNLADAISVADRVREDFAGHAFETPKGRATSTVSIGVATAEQVGFDIEKLLAAADAAVYEAKARGRNRVAVAGAANIPLRAATTGDRGKGVKKA
jgi:diguanylate cyclase (GGDEF)-like protein